MPRIRTNEQAVDALERYLRYSQKADRVRNDLAQGNGRVTRKQVEECQRNADDELYDVFKFLGASEERMLRIGRVDHG